MGRKVRVLVSKELLNEVERQRILYSNFPPMGDISEEMRTENTKRFFPGSVRIQRGMYRTTEEDRRYREDSLKRKLP